MQGRERRSMPGRRNPAGQRVDLLRSHGGYKRTASDRPSPCGSPLRPRRQHEFPMRDRPLARPPAQPTVRRHGRPTPCPPDQSPARPTIVHVRLPVRAVQVEWRLDLIDVETHVGRVLAAIAPLHGMPYPRRLCRAPSENVSKVRSIAALLRRRPPADSCEATRSFSSTTTNSPCVGR